MVDAPQVVSPETLAARTRSADDVGEQIRSTAESGLHVLLARGQYSPFPATAQRVIAIGTTAPHRALADAWMTDAEFERLRHTIGESFVLRVGECDAMFATRWRYAWGTNAEGKFALCTPTGIQVFSIADGLYVAQAQQTLAPSQIRSVEGRLSHDWIRRSVVLNLGDAAGIEVAVAEDAMAGHALYSATELVCDASWVRSLATMLSEVTGARLVLPAEL